MRPGTVHAAGPLIMYKATRRSGKLQAVLLEISANLEEILALVLPEIDCVSLIALNSLKLLFQALELRDCLYLVIGLIICPHLHPFHLRLAQSGHCFNVAIQVGL